MAEKKYTQADLDNAIQAAVQAAVQAANKRAAHAEAVLAAYRADVAESARRVAERYNIQEDRPVADWVTALSGRGLVRQVVEDGVGVADDLEPEMVTDILSIWLFVDKNDPSAKPVPNKGPD